MKQRAFTAALAVALCAPACTTVDTAGALNTIGRTHPVEQHDTLPPAELNKNKGKRYTVHTHGNTAYIAIPVRYLPARAKWFHCLQVGGCPVMEPQVRHRDFSQYHHPKDGIYYAVVAKEHLHSPHLAAHVQQLIPATAAPLPQGTTTGTIALPRGAHSIINSHLNADFSPANTAIQPLRWVATVVDVPLSIVATPINWVLQPLGVNLWYY